jgi:hypothetical protein
MLPSRASGKTLDAIFKDHPGRNIILSFRHGAAPGWIVPNPDDPNDKPDNPGNSQLWPDIRQIWNHEDSSEKGIQEKIVETMLVPPVTNYPWALSATVWDFSTGPLHMVSGHPIRTIPFEGGGANVNIYMTDFLGRTDTQVGVVDRCIDLSLKVARDKTPPSKPTNLVVRQYRLGDEGAKPEYVENSTLFYYNRSSDAVNVSKYEILQNGRVIITTSDTRHLVKDLNKLNSIFKVRAQDTSGNWSDYSDEFELIQDKIAPSMISGLKFELYGYPVVRIAWVAATDDNGSGIAGYEVRCNGVFKGFTVNLFFELTAGPEENLLIEVRAKDKNGNYSEWEGIVRPGLPKLTNPTIDYVPIEMVPNAFRAMVRWDSIPQSFLLDMPIALDVFTNDFPIPYRILYQYETPPTWEDYAIAGQKFDIKASLFFMNTGENSPRSTINLDGDIAFPEPVKNVRITSQTSTEMVVSWDKSGSVGVVGYAISVNEQPPYVVPASETSYKLSMISGSNYPIEIWAIDSNGTTSVSESITVSNGLPAPRILFPTNESIVDARTTVSGKEGVSGATVRFYQAGSGVIEYGTALVREDGGWSAPPETPFPPGNFDLTCYQIRDGQQSGYSEVVTFTINPGNPGELSVTDITSTSARLEWTFPGGSGIRFRIKVNGFVVAQTGETFFQLNYLRYFTEYKVEVYAFAGGWVSEPSSATFKTLVHPPTNLRFSQSNGNCKLRWGPLWGTSLTHEISINDKVFNTPAGRWGYNFKLADILPGPPYHLVFKVRAQIGDDKSEEVVHEVTLSDGAPPGAPGKPAASEITDTHARLDWAQPSSNDAVAYIMYFNGFPLYTYSDNYYILDGLKAGNYYHVAVRAIDKDGNKSTFSQTTSFKTSGQPASPPPLPPEIKLANPTPTGVTLQWSAPGAVAGIRVIVNDEHYADRLIFPALGISDLVPDERYKIEVYSLDLHGQLSELPTTVVYEPVVTTPPSAPGSFEVSEQVGNSVNLVWAPSENEFGAGAYFVYWGEVCLGRTEVPSFTATYLPPGSHVIQVREMDPFGNLSEVASIQVDIEPDSIN